MTIEELKELDGFREQSENNIVVSKNAFLEELNGGLGNDMMTDLSTGRAEEKVSVWTRLKNNLRTLFLK